MKVYFNLIKTTAKRYSVGKLAEMGAQMLYGRDGERKLIPALKEMFFNVMEIVTERRGTYYFDGAMHNFTHAEFVKLYRFAMSNWEEICQITASENDARRVYELTQTQPETCFFTGEITRLYRDGGANTYYITPDGILRSARGKIVSRSISRNMLKCGSCQSYVIETFLKMRRDADGYRYCPECACNLQDCAGCGRLSGGEKCGKCRDFYSVTNSYGSKPLKFWFFDKLKGKLIKEHSEKSGLYKRVKAFYMGDEHEVEFEAATGSAIRERAKEVRESYKGELFYTTEDCTVSRGFEMHTHPATHKAHKGRKWGGIAFLRNKGAASFNSNNAGLHIHLNRNAFTNWHFLKFIKFLMDNISVTLAIGRRKNINNLNEYAPFEFNFFHRVKKVIARDLRRGDLYTHPTVKIGGRGAVNLQNDNTIELRFLGGSLDEQKYKAKIDYIQALYEYTAQSGYKSQSVTEFCNYVRERKTVSDT